MMGGRTDGHVYIGSLLTTTGSSSTTTTTLSHSQERNYILSSSLFRFFFFLLPRIVGVPLKNIFTIRMMHVCMYVCRNFHNLLYLNSHNFPVVGILNGRLDVEIGKNGKIFLEFINSRVKFFRVLHKNTPRSCSVCVCFFFENHKRLATNVIYRYALRNCYRLEGRTTTNLL